jgi:hypothetical protein
MKKDEITLKDLLLNMERYTDTEIANEFERLTSCYRSDKVQSIINDIESISVEVTTDDFTKTDTSIGYKAGAGWFNEHKANRVAYLVYDLICKLPDEFEKDAFEKEWLEKSFFAKYYCGKKRSRAADPPQLTIPDSILQELQKTTNKVGKFKVKQMIEDAVARPLKWLATKQDLRELLTHDKIRGKLSIADVERLTSSLFIDKNGRPVSLAKNKTNGSIETDFIKEFLATM